MRWLAVGFTALPAGCFLLGLLGRVGSTRHAVHVVIAAIGIELVVIAAAALVEWWLSE